MEDGGSTALEAKQKTSVLYILGHALGSMSAPRDKRKHQAAYFSQCLGKKFEGLAWKVEEARVRKKAREPKGKGRQRVKGKGDKHNVRLGHPVETLCELSS